MDDEIRDIMDLKFEGNKKDSKKTDNEDEGNEKNALASLGLDESDTTETETLKEPTKEVAVKEKIKKEKPVKEKTKKEEVVKVKPVKEKVVKEKVVKEKPVKEKIVKEKKNKPPKDRNEKAKATGSLLMTLSWITVMFLSIIFEIDLILSLIDLINSADTIIPIFNSLAAKYFFIGLSFSIEILLFLFFIIYAIYRAIVNSKPWNAYRKSTESQRYAIWIATAREKETLLITKLDVFGVKKHAAKYNDDYKKELREIKANINKLKIKLKKALEAENNKQ